MRCRIHRGCHEIGGNCIEIESGGKRIVLDLGLPLSDTGGTVLPDIDGLSSADESLLGVFISHPHPDHYGLLEIASMSAPVYMGAVARRIIEVSSFFTPLPTIGDIQPLTIQDRRQIRLGPFKITPIRVDHSACDSYCFLVEADGTRLLYSGDIRGHGRRSSLFDDLVRNPPADIDVLICEGTQVGRIQDFAYPDENAVVDAMSEVFAETDGMCLVWCSSQNTDRLVSIWEASKRSARKLILDVYTAEIIQAAVDPNLPCATDSHVSIYLPISQRQRIKREKAFEITNPYYPFRIYPEDLPKAAPDSAMIFRPSMLPELARARCLEGAHLISSVWAGYIRRDQDLAQELLDLRIERTHIHTSGHATVTELKTFIDAVAAERVVPIHLEDRQGFGKLSDRVEFKNDYEWWKV